ncbi:MAG: DegV family protein [Eubacteriales bacterium]|nr:DegV family protein [Eubacteriales bacterium]
MKIAVVTDSHSGISQEEAKQLGLYVIPAPFIVDGRQYEEGINLTEREFYEKMEAGADLSTSQSSPADILDLWDRLLEEYDQIVCIPLSSGLTGAYQTMTMLAEDEPYEGRVFPVDNTTVSVTERIAALNALALAKQGYDGAGIKRILEENRKNNLIFITVTTLKYLKKGGRITPAAAALGTLLKIKPVLKIDGEKLDAFAKVRTMSQARETMLAAIQECLTERLKDPGAEHSYIMVAHTQNAEMAEELLEIAKERWPKADFCIAPLALAIACHTGPGSLAIVAERKLQELDTH